MTPRRELVGAPESRRTPAALAQRGSTPAPPWRCRVEAVVWWQHVPAAVRAAVRQGVQAALPRGLAGRAGSVVGASVRYLDSPVGPYEEVVGAVVLRPLLLHVPFLAVDSLPSLQGGREHWALPKVLARVERTGPYAVVARGEGWQLDVGATARGPRLPVAGALPGRQVDADGRPVGLRVAAYGTWRPARVDVRVGSDCAGKPGSIAGWLRSGRHPGAVLSLALHVGRGRR